MAIQLHKLSQGSGVPAIACGHGTLCHDQGGRAHGVRAHLHGNEYDPPGHPCVYGSAHVHEGVRDHANGCARGSELHPHAYVREYAYENADVNERARVDEVLP